MYIHQILPGIPRVALEESDFVSSQASPAEPAQPASLPLPRVLEGWYRDTMAVVQTAKLATPPEGGPYG